MAASSNPRSRVSARDRARMAKAQMDAARAEQDRQILAATEAWYTAVDAEQDARAALELAGQDKAAAVAQLTALGQTIDTIASLCGIDAKEVRALRKVSTSEASAPEDADPEQGSAA